MDSHGETIKVKLLRAVDGFGHNIVIQGYHEIARQKDESRTIYHIQKYSTGICKNRDELRWFRVGLIKLLDNKIRFISLCRQTTGSENKIRLELE